jgi:multiple sugar transport system substrate-binding protein
MKALSKLSCDAVRLFLGTVMLNLNALKSRPLNGFIHGCALSVLLALGSNALAQKTLTVAAFPAMDEIVKSAIPEWKKLHPDVDIKVISRQFNDHHTAMTTALSTSVYLPDVMAIEIGYLGRFSQGGGLEELSKPPYNIGRFKERYVPYAYQQATNSKGAVMAAPTDIGPGTLLYRTDILTKAGVTEAQLTQSWDSYVKSGVLIKAHTGAFLMAHARDMKDIMIRTDIKPGEGIYFDNQSRVLVNSPRFERAFELAKKIRQHGLDGKISAWSNEWGEGFKSGKLATQMTGAWLVGHLNNWLAPQTKGLWRATNLPEGANAAYGGAFYAITKTASAENKALAWELIQMLTLKREQQLAAFKSQDAFPALVETHNDAFFKQPIAFLGNQTARTLWRDTASQIKAVAVHKQDAFAEEVINTELDKVLDKGKDIKVALSDAAALLKTRALR